MYWGYAVNYYGYHRNTEDMDIWIAPTNENKICFLNTLRCMNYSDQELETIKEEDFSTYFMCSLGEPPFVIDILTIIHKDVDFSNAEKEANIHIMQDGTELMMIPYDLLKEVKLRSRRQKDLFDIARLEEIRNPK
jgi:hypothetical protein